MLSPFDVDGTGLSGTRTVDLAIDGVTPCTEPNAGEGAGPTAGAQPSAHAGRVARAGAGDSPPGGCGCCVLGSESNGWPSGPS